MTDHRADLYAEQLGREAAERQAELAKTRHRCCGEHKAGPHHEACSKWVEPAPQVHDDQIGLL